MQITKSIIVMVIFLASCKSDKIYTLDDFITVKIASGYHFPAKGEVYFGIKDTCVFNGEISKSNYLNCFIMKGSKGCKLAQIYSLSLNGRNEKNNIDFCSNDSLQITVVGVMRSKVFVKNGEIIVIDSQFNKFKNSIQM